MLIGGLVSRSRSHSESRAPLLHEIPVLGWLFRRQEISDEELELVIVVHPTLVREPSSRARLWIFPDPLAPGAGDRERQALEEAARSID